MIIAAALAALTLIVLLAPLRSRLILGGAWLATILAIVGVVIGLTYAARMVSEGGPAWLLIAAPIMGAVMLGGAGKEMSKDDDRPNGRGRR